MWIRQNALIVFRMSLPAKYACFKQHVMIHLHACAFWLLTTKATQMSSSTTGVTVHSNVSILWFSDCHVSNRGSVGTNHDLLIPKLIWYRHSHLAITVTFCTVWSVVGWHIWCRCACTSVVIGWLKYLVPMYVWSVVGGNTWCLHVCTSVVSSWLKHLVPMYECNQ